MIKGFKVYQDVITEEKDIYKNQFCEYKENFENIVIIFIFLKKKKYNINKIFKTYYSIL